MASKDVPIPVGTLVGKWDFANVIQVEDFEISPLDYPGGPSLLKSRGGSQRCRGTCDSGGVRETNFSGFEDGEQSLRAKKCRLPPDAGRVLP